MSFYRSLYMMKGNPFVSDMHFLHKAMEPIVFPTTKEDIIKKVGNVVVKMGWETEITVKELITPYKRTEFENAHQFYNSVLAYIYK